MSVESCSGSINVSLLQAFYNGIPYTPNLGGQSTLLDVAYTWTQLLVPYSGQKYASTSVVDAAARLWIDFGANVPIDSVVIENPRAFYDTEPTGALQARMNGCMLVLRLADGTITWSQAITTTQNTYHINTFGPLTAASPLSTVPLALAVGCRNYLSSTVPILWARAADLVAILSDGSPVTTWRQVDGTRPPGVGLTSGTGSLPVFYNNVSNPFPFVHFNDAANINNVNGGYMDFGSLMLNLGITGYTAFVCVRFVTGSGWGRIFDITNNTFAQPSQSNDSIGMCMRPNTWMATWVSFDQVTARADQGVLCYCRTQKAV
jgi:hypothetical protein